MRWLIPFLLPILLVMSADRDFSMLRPVLGPSSPVRAVAIPFDHDDPRHVRVGRLLYLQGWRLENDDPAFGSFSSLAVGPGPGLLLLNDAGGFVRMTLGPRGPTGGHFGNLPGGPGGSAIKVDRDSESLTRKSGDGPIWVGFEARNAIYRYSADLSRTEAGRRPPEMRKWPGNGGAEAIVRLRSGRFLVFCETCYRGPPGSTEALRFDRDPTDPNAKVTPFNYRRPAGYRVTDAAELPDGRVLILHRKLGLRPLFSAKLAIFDPRTIEKDGLMTAAEIATLAPPLAVDNMEGLAITREGDQIIVWMASDDNFGTPFQRSLLLKFRLLDRPGAGKGR
jgi:hypothetical protein